MEVYLFLLCVAVNLLIGALIGKAKGRVGAGVFWAFLLGPVGWLIVAAGPNLKPKCPYCKGTVIPSAVKCRNCGSELKSGEVESVSQTRTDRTASPFLRAVLVVLCLIFGFMIAVFLAAAFHG